MSNCLDPDHVGPDLGPNCLQRLSADGKIKSDFILNPLNLGNPLTSMFANSEDPDEMQHNAAFHQGLHCLFK